MIENDQNHVFSRKISKKRPFRVPAVLDCGFGSLQFLRFCRNRFYFGFGSKKSVSKPSVPRFRLEST